MDLNIARYGIFQQFGSGRGNVLNKCSCFLFGERLLLAHRIGGSSKSKI